MICLKWVIMHSKISLVQQITMSLTCFCCCSLGAGGQRLLSICQEEQTMRSRIIGEQGYRSRHANLTLSLEARDSLMLWSVFGCQGCSKRWNRTILQALTLPWQAWWIWGILEKLLWVQRQAASIFPLCFHHLLHKGNLLWMVQIILVPCPTPSIHPQIPSHFHSYLKFLNTPKVLQMCLRTMFTAIQSRTIVMLIPITMAWKPLTWIPFQPSELTTSHSLIFRPQEMDGC